MSTLSFHTLNLHAFVPPPITPLLSLHSSPFTPHPSLLTPHSSPFTPHPSLLTLHSSPFTPHPSLTLHSSTLTPHPSLLTLLSSPFTPHPSLLTLHSSPFTPSPLHPSTRLDEKNFLCAGLANGKLVIFDQSTFQSDCAHGQPLPLGDHPTPIIAMKKLRRSLFVCVGLEVFVVRTSSWTVKRHLTLTPVRWATLRLAE